MKTFYFTIIVLLFLITDISFSQGENHVCGTVNLISTENPPCTTRPLLPRSFSTQNFKVHYDNSTNINYVIQIANWAEESRTALENRGWLMPPRDGMAGGDGKYDIYLEDTYNLCQAAGICVQWRKDIDSINYPQYSDRFSSFIKLIN